MADEATETLTFDRVPMTMNRYLRLCSYARVRERQTWERHISALRRTGGRRRPEPIGDLRARVEICVFRYRRVQDEDNFQHGGVKPLIDALRHQRVIRDDSRKWIDLKVEETAVKTHAEQGTVVRVTRLGPVKTSDDPTAGIRNKDEG